MLPASTAHPMTRVGWVGWVGWVGCWDARRGENRVISKFVLIRHKFKNHAALNNDDDEDSSCGGV